MYDINNTGCIDNKEMVTMVRIPFGYLFIVAELPKGSSEGFAK